MLSKSMWALSCHAHCKLFTLQRCSLLILMYPYHTGVALNFLGAYPIVLHIDISSARTALWFIVGELDCCSQIYSLPTHFTEALVAFLVVWVYPQIAPLAHGPMWLNPDLSVPKKALSRISIIPIPTPSLSSLIQFPRVEDVIMQTVYITWMALY